MYGGIINVSNDVVVLLEYGGNDIAPFITVVLEGAFDNDAGKKLQFVLNTNYVVNLCK